MFSELQTDPTLAYLGLFGFGAFLHIAYFNHGEHHMYGALYASSFFALQASVLAILILYSPLSARQALGYTLSGAFSLAAGLYTSLAIYRLFLSSLCKFPGPFGARLSDFYFSFQCRTQVPFRQILKYHRKYGDFVRVGSNTVSIADPNAVDIVYGANSPCRKADWYDMTYPIISMHSTRSKALHDQRRRIWSNAFSAKALRGYEQRLHGFQDKLLSQISAFGGQPIDVTKWFNLYSFDVMGDLAFGADLEMLESRQEHWAIKLLGDGLSPLSFLLPLWFFRVMVAIPGLTDDWWKFIAYCRSSLEYRIKNKPAVPDIMSSLLSSYEDSKPPPEEMQLLCGESHLIIVAGSDTTSTTLTFLFYELAKHPEHFALLRKEVEPYMPSDGTPPKGQDLQYLPHLNGVINETLRLYPGVPTAMQRLTPPEGLDINGTFVPGNTVVYCPQYAICRSETAFVHAQEFIPERWTTRPELVKHSKAFAPFSSGPFGCIGRPLAILNLQTTIVQLLQRFDIELAPGKEATTLEERTSERFVLAPGSSKMTFRERAQHKS